MDINNLAVLLFSSAPGMSIIANEKEVFGFIPELKKCKGFNQNTPEWHIYDVYEHTLHVIDYVPNDIALRLAALFHDLGKPLTYAVDEHGIGHFYGHWIESQKIFDKFASKHNLDKELSNLVSNLIYYHDIDISKLSKQEIDKMSKNLGQKGIKMLFQLKEADILAQNPKKHCIIEKYQKEKKLF